MDEVTFNSVRHLPPKTVVVVPADFAERHGCDRTISAENVLKLENQPEPYEASDPFDAFDE